MQYNFKAKQLKKITKDKSQLAKNSSLLVVNLQVTIPKINDPKQHHTVWAPLAQANLASTLIRVFIKHWRLAILNSVEREAAATHRAKTNPTVNYLQGTDRGAVQEALAWDSLEAGVGEGGEE